MKKRFLIGMLRKNHTMCLVNLATLEVLKADRYNGLASLVEIHVGTDYEQACNRITFEIPIDFTDSQISAFEPGQIKMFKFCLKDTLEQPARTTARLNAMELLLSDEDGRESIAA